MNREGLQKTTAFVSHYDCARHDTGWNHPEHQGRLPAIMRAVYQDMLTLFEPLLEVQGRHATEPELQLVHSAAYLARLREWVQDAADLGRPTEIEPGIVVSDASWDAARAAAGCVLEAIDTVEAGTTRNAFCAVRPPGRDAGADDPGGFGLVNSTAIGARYLTASLGRQPVLVFEWGGGAPSGLRDVLAADPAVTVATVAVGDGAAPSVDPLLRTIPSRSGIEALREATAELLETVAARNPPAFVLLSAGFDVLESDPLGDLALQTADLYSLTREVREWSDRICEGRLVSVLEGGYDARPLGAAVVQHLRALADLDPAD